MWCCGIVNFVSIIACRQSEGRTDEVKVFNVWLDTKLVEDEINVWLQEKGDSIKIEIVKTGEAELYIFYSEVSK